MGQMAPSLPKPPSYELPLFVTGVAQIPDGTGQWVTPSGAELGWLLATQLLLNSKAIVDSGEIFSLESSAFPWMKISI